MIQNMTAEEVKAALAAVPETEPDEIEVLEAIKKRIRQRENKKI